MSSYQPYNNHDLKDIKRCLTKFIEDIQNINILNDIHNWFHVDNQQLSNIKLLNIRIDNLEYSLNELTTRIINIENINNEQSNVIQRIDENTNK